MPSGDGNPPQVTTPPDRKRRQSDSPKETQIPLSSIPVPSTAPNKTDKKPLPTPKRNVSRQPVKKICLSLTSQPVSDPNRKETKVKPVSEVVSKVFGADDESEDETEVMPAEARMRMRNKGRDTPTSSGPNSYGKGRYGFIDRRALLDRQIEAMNNEVSGDNDGVVEK